MQIKLPQSAPHAARRGTSLIEILVVLVILVVGILSIVRLFPAGFIALRNAENNTFADRLAQSALELLKKNNAGLPDAIYMYSTTDGFNPNFAPGDFGAYPTTGTADSSYSDINKQRYISNETITIPSPRSVVTGPGAGGMGFLPLHVLNYGPIYLPTSSDTFTTFLPINSLLWTPQAGDSRPNPSDPSRAIDNPLDILQPGQQKYLVDLAGGRLALPTAAYLKNGSTTVYVNQDFVAVIGTANGPQTVSLSVPNIYNGNWFDNTTANTTFSSAALPNGPWTSVTLYRPFRYMGTTTSPSFDADPYEYALYSSNIAGTNGNPGVIAFNPLAAGQGGSSPLKARISYMVLDWHILHEDHDVSEGSPTVRLALGHIKKVGDVQFDQSLYNGLVSRTNAVTDATNPADIMMVNLDSGQVTTLNGQAGTSAVGNTAGTVSVVDADQTNTPSTTAYQVSYQNGRITFPDNTAAQHLRFFYAGDADWALAVQKAPSAYTIVNAPGGAIRTPATGANGDYVKLTQTGIQSGSTPNNCVIDLANQRAYFPVCDAGKTVEFDGISYTDGKGVSQVVSEGTAAISSDTVTVDGQAVAYVNLGSGGLNPSGILPAAPGSGTSPAMIQAVRGISAQATVIWHERNKWRTRTIDTLLTQTQ